MDGRKALQVERNGKLYTVGENCLIRSGDIVRPGTGSSATVIMFREPRLEVAPCGLRLRNPAVVRERVIR